MDKIKYTERGFNYVEVTPKENIAWGGGCVCNYCNNVFYLDNMYLVYVLNDVYCKKCFNDWIERSKKYPQSDVDHDLKLQNEYSFEWYKGYLPYLKIESRC